MFSKCPNIYLFIPALACAAACSSAPDASEPADAGGPADMGTLVVPPPPDSGVVPIPDAGTMTPTVVCGNGVLEPGETCDTAIAAGVGHCPVLAECNDRVACTADTLAEVISGNACTRQCAHAPIVIAGPGDGCCPSGATAASDNDCSAACGDGVLDNGETCDTAITSGTGRCPDFNACNDGNSCTTDQLLSAGTCNAQCLHNTISAAGPADGCCPIAGTPRSEDADCPQLGTYYPCEIDGDCVSGLCIAFDWLQGDRACSTTCNGDSVDIRGGCAVPASNYLPICLTRPYAASPPYELCVLSEVDPYVATDLDGGHLGQLATLTGTLQAMDDVDVFFLSGVAPGSSLPASITVTPSAGLDPAIAIMSETMTFVSSCNNTGGSQAETCPHTVPGGARVYVWVFAAQGTGGYSISATYGP